MFDKDVKTITARKAIELGVEPGILWNVERDKEIDISIFIVGSLKKGYTDEIILKMFEIFSIKRVIDSFEQYKNRVGEKLYNRIIFLSNKEVF